MLLRSRVTLVALWIKGGPYKGTIKRHKSKQKGAFYHLLPVSGEVILQQLQQGCGWGSHREHGVAF